MSIGVLALEDLPINKGYRDLSNFRTEAFNRARMREAGVLAPTEDALLTEMSDIKNQFSDFVLRLKTLKSTMRRKITVFSRNEGNLVGQFRYIFEAISSKFLWVFVGTNTQQKAINSYGLYYHE
ncbi:hypothetical protein EIN_164770 [Entamoeba invadens IP1]|uniref:Uncharacterized protein n=1 Tax=Entamoeba invadens IP1 TaxID=370355 RepID=A0A0A1U499_ENTIV|nr:hypothetical protein EIN_164770 [Entamoeba invadens IP1]ELP89047.1 hypothetical protein EIN_164770 [Entamoeba invadens IP1]|eukprot:XP_004255818.1 hypothetical protein EIN_164770 [Entamoeba invadens IP1]